jgi:hypothetical protein
MCCSDFVRTHDHDDVTDDVGDTTDDGGDTDVKTKDCALNTQSVTICCPTHTKSNADDVACQNLLGPQ